MKKSNEVFITNSNSLKLKSTYETSNVSNIIKKNEEKSKEKEKITENFLDYLINDNSNFANFQKVTEYYENKLRKYIDIYNRNLEIIKHKKEEIQKYKINIFNQVINNISFENKHLDLYYEKMIEKFKKEINLTKHELEVYKNSFNDIYRKNYTLNSKLENISKSEKIFEEQHDKYVNIRDAALSKLLKQEEMLKTLKFYFAKIQDFNKNLVAKKQKKLRQLNYEIHVIKSEEEQNEEFLKMLSEKNDELNTYIEKQKYQNLICLKDINLYTKNYIKDRCNMDEIFEISKEKNIEHIINSYNKLKFQNQELSKLFSQKSKKILNLNTTLTNLNKEYNFTLKTIKQKHTTEKEEVKKDIINHSDYIENMKITKEKIKQFLEDKGNLFMDNLRLFINIIISSLDLISNINHSRNISVVIKEALPYEKRDDLIEKYQNFFDNTIIKSNKINFEKQLFNSKFLKFLVFIIKELNFQIKSIISNVYQILYVRKKDKKYIKRKTLIDIDILNIHKGNNRNNKISEENSDEKDLLITNFNFKEYQKLYDAELNFKKRKLEERKKFFETEEKDIFINKVKQEKQSQEENLSNNKSNIFPSIDSLNKNRSTDCISTKDFLKQYYNHYTKSVSETDNVSQSLNNNSSKVNLNKFNFIINYANDFVSNKKEYEEKKFQKYQNILKKSKIIKEEIERKEIAKYIKRNKKIKKLLREQYQRNLSTDSEKEEKDKKEELALEMINKELAELKKPKRFVLKYTDKEVSKIYERYDDLRALELNFLKNKGNFLIDSGFFNEYYFQLKKQFDDNKKKEHNLKIRINKKIFMKPIKKKNDINRNKNMRSNINKAQSLFDERNFQSDRNRNKKIYLKKIQGASIYRNNSEILHDTFRKKNISS